MSSSTLAASPTIPMSARTFLEIEDGSMSMWILREPGEKASSLPVTRSSKRAPMATMTSQSCMALLASKLPCMPSMPSHFSSEAGKAPSPIRVEVTGAPVRAANSRSSAEALGPALMTPPPV